MKKGLIFLILIGSAVFLVTACNPEPVSQDPEDGLHKGNLTTSNNEDTGRNTHRTFRINR